ERSLGALAHHLAQLARQDQLAAAGRARGLDEQDVAAHRGPGEARGDARHAGAHRDFALELAGPQDSRKVARIDADRPRLALGNAYRGVAERLADLALQAA